MGSVIEQQCDPSCGPEEGREMRGNDEAGASEKVVCRGVAGGEQHGGGGGFMRPQAPSGRHVTCTHLQGFYLAGKGGDFFSPLGNRIIVTSCPSLEF